MPGKTQTRCKGPFIFLRSVGRGGATLELLADNGEVRPAAIGNVIPFRGRLEDVATPSEQAVRIKRQRVGDGGWATLDQVAPLQPHGGSEWSDSADSLTLSDSSGEA